MKINTQNKTFLYLKDIMNTYYPLSEKTLEKLFHICLYKQIKKHDYICRSNQIQTSFFFVDKGLFRSYIVDEKGNQYNKAFFSEGMFPGSMVALLKKEESFFEIQALEDSIIIEINFEKYRKLLYEFDDLKLFHIHYLEENWLIKKESREVSFVQKDAKERYEDFVYDYPNLESRLTQYHVASHLGITPTQLSRIRKKINICK